MVDATIVVPSRGGAARLPLLLDALAAQVDATWEAVIILDGDIDDSASVVSRYAERLPVRAIVFPENRGRVAALNAGFTEAQGGVLIRCDDDLRPRPDYVARHVASHAGAQQGTVGLCRNIYPATTYSRLYGRDMDVQFRQEAYAFPDDFLWRYWSGNVSVTKQTWDEIGPYDARYRAYGWEDVDYGYRLHQAGVPIVLDPTLETDHYVAATTTEVRAVRAFHSGAARHTFESIHGPAPLAHLGSTRHGPWERLVHATARALDAKRVALMARGIDKTIGRVPKKVARKMVALCVESSSEAGYHRPIGVSNDV